MRGLITYLVNCVVFLIILLPHQIYSQTKKDFYLSEKKGDTTDFIFTSLKNWESHQWYDDRGTPLNTYPSDLSTVVLRESENLIINFSTEKDSLILTGVRNTSQNKPSLVSINTNDEFTINIGSFIFYNGNLHLEGYTLLSTNSITFPNKVGLVKVEKNAELIVEGSYSAQNQGSNHYSIEVKGEATFGALNAQTKFGVLVAETGYCVLKNIMESKNNLDLKICGTMEIKNFKAKNGLSVDLCGSKGANCMKDDGNGGRLLIDGEFSCRNSISVNNCGYISANDSNCDCIICDGDIDLPVELIYFKGQITPTGHLLLWETVSEHNSSHFNIQVSDDRRNWRTIGTVQGAGYSQVNLKYEYHNENNLGEYYRLEQVDFDSEKEYFGIVSFNNVGEEFTAKVYPTVVQPSQQVNIEMRNINTNFPVVAVLYDVEGVVMDQKILVDEPSNHLTSFYEIPKIVNSGVYLLLISNARKSVTEKIVIP
ncbi:hypothetical protein [Flammeovirga pacifica]|uniref:Secretion system C-terminal sorting domain-containing protein n=1 Tax=Flammeovirga pacifica TaxID=915059 RepID=A0A1S1YTW0_FLAPC|nr:hypothetical protein [Flammeovirga pacifica]OHX64303.1 hypothetical protein NH26_22160 [Flammeovirga pacifica]